MKKRSRNILVLLLAVCLAAVFSGSAFAALAPLNPEFVKWQQSGNVNKKNYITMKNGTKFLPGKIPSPLNWSHLNNLSWSVSARNSVRVDFPLPASYDLRPNMPAVKDQSDLGTCWTFSAAAATESNLIKKGLAASSDIKTGNWYLAYYGFHDESPSLPSFTNSTGELYFNVGGDDWQSVALLSRGTGSVSYDQARYPVNSTDIYPPTLVKRTYKLTDALYLGNGEAREVRLVEARRDMIKRALMTHGALSIGIFQGDYLNSATGAYFGGSVWPGRTNHAVTIVGWDDGYAVGNFNAAKQPTAPGAWIVRNSWGTGYGDRGYYYVSYQEGSIADGVAYLTEKEPANEKIYQYDPLGACNWYGSSTGGIKAANTFRAISDDEDLTSVAFYTAYPDTTCVITIYSGEGSTPATGSMAALKTETVAAPGYHTVSLDKAVRLVRGDKFSVVVELMKSGEKGLAAVEYPLVGHSDKARANVGESFIWNGARYIDLTTEEQNANFCIKAFTTPGAPVAKLVTSVSLDQTAKNMKVDEEFVLSVDVKPDDATSRDLFWGVSDPTVLNIVSSDAKTCKVKALKAGTAKVTAAAMDGSGKSAFCYVNVAAAGGSGGGGGGGGTPGSAPSPSPSPAPEGFDSSSDLPAVLGGSAIPDDSGKLNGTAVEINGVQTVSGVVEAESLTAIGVEAKAEGGKLILNGEPTATGTFTITVTLPDGSKKQVQIVINEVAKPVETLIDPGKAKTEWTVEYSGSSAAPSFVMWLPVTVDSKEGFAEQPSVEFEGASGTALVVEGSGRGATTKWIKITGTVTDKSKAAVKSVKFRVGAVAYTQAVDVKLVDTKFTDKSTDSSAPTHKSSGGGCDAGFGVIALFAAAVIKRRTMK